GDRPAGTARAGPGSPPRQGDHRGGHLGTAHRVGWRKEPARLGPRTSQRRGSTSPLDRWRETLTYTRTTFYTRKPRADDVPARFQKTQRRQEAQWHPRTDHRACTTPRTSTTPAAWRSWPTCTAAATTRWCGTG